MSDRNFNADFDSEFDDEFDDEFEDEDDLFEQSGRGARPRMMSDRTLTLLNQAIQEIEQVSPEHLPNLIQMIRLFRQSVASAEQIARTEQRGRAGAQDSAPIQPTVLPPLEPLNELPMRSPARPPVERLIEQDIEQNIEPSTKPPNEPPLIPLRLPRFSESKSQPTETASETEKIAPPENAFAADQATRPSTNQSDESDWDELMDFLDQGSPKAPRDIGDSRDDDWDEYFQPSPLK